MPFSKQVLQDAIMVGLVSMIIDLILNVGIMYAVSDGFKISDIDFWPSMMFGGFIGGFVFHLIWSRYFNLK
jgi:hypothetical protein